MCSKRERWNCKGENDNKCWPQLAQQYGIHSGCASIENWTAEYGLFMNLHDSW